MRTNTAIGVMLALLAGGTLAGCRGPTAGYTTRETDSGTPRRDGGTGSTEGPTSCTLAEDDTFCLRYAQAFCTAHFACCDDTSAQYENETLCIDEQACACAGNREGAAFEAGHVTLDAAAADAMIARIEERAETCDGLPFAETDAASVFRGTLEAGADCTPTSTDYSSIFACAPGTYCLFDAAAEETTVTAAHCAAYAAIGASCGAGAECAPGAHCVGGTTEETIDDPATCVENLPPGAPCVDDFDCQSELCDEVSLTCASFDPQETWCTDGEDEEASEDV